MKRKWYWKTLISLSILVALFIISVNTEPQPENTKLLLYDENGKFIGAPPAGPSKTFPLGTDTASRSMLHLVLEGLKYTIAISVGIAVLRVLIGGTLGIISAIWLPNFKYYFKALFLPFQYIPALLIGIILLTPIAASYRGIPYMMIVEYQAIVLLVVGLPSVFIFMNELVEDIKKQPFILSSSLMGASKYRLLTKHIMPFLKSHLTLLTVQQVLQVLQLLMFLGIFSIYLGGAHPTPISDHPRVIYRSITSELAGMTGQNYWLMLRAPWMPMAPIIGVVFLVLLINTIKKELEENLVWNPIVPSRKKAFKWLAFKKGKYVRYAPAPTNSFILIGLPSSNESEDYLPQKYKSDMLRALFRRILKKIYKTKVYQVMNSWLKRLLFQKERGMPFKWILLIVPLVIVTTLFITRLDTPKTASTTQKEKPIISPIYEKSYTNRNAVPVNYKADVTFNDTKSTLDGTLDIESTNFSEKKNDHIYFHLYPNQFREKLTDEKWITSLGEEQETGWVDIYEVLVDGSKASFEVKGTLLDIQMEGWDKNEVAKIKIKFEIKIPKNNGHSSYDHAGTWLGNWLPVQAVHDQNGWNLHSYSPFGTPFYSEAGNYDVTLRVPEKYKVITNGNDQKAVVHTSNGSTVNQVQVENVRDFSAAFLDINYYEVMIYMVGDTMINTWYRKNDDSNIIHYDTKTVSQALEHYSNLYGKYPFTEFDIVRTGDNSLPASSTGMLFSPGYNFKEYYGAFNLVEETARQWWGGMVGSNGAKEPWLSESLTSYSSKKVMRMVGGPQEERTEELKTNINLAEAEKQYISSTLEEFKSATNHRLILFLKGSDMLVELEKQIGEDKMMEVLQKFSTEYQNKNASGQDFITTFSYVAGPETEQYFEKWLSKKEQSK
ncbi:M1 family aminopeptidase [Peribacillus acanthi]|uniref:M1 family aminopeptidase n=1 Tax=Peribacillus acanthi TaxID=2171554 RepID=UPI000D3ECCF8|nr:M1 family aminopeptidase [Peribacillus acanthi]